MKRVLLLPLERLLIAVFVAISALIALTWLVFDFDEPVSEIPEGCTVVDFNPSKSADYRMVCREDSHPVPEAR